MRIINAMVRGLASAGVHPNILTAIGVVINVGCGVLFGFGEFFWAGIVLIVANIFDMLDGNVARLTGNVTKFGGFLDSTLDRLSDMVRFSRHNGLLCRKLAAAFAASRHTGGRGNDGVGDGQLYDGPSEGLGVKANVGFLQRPERVVLLIIGALSTWNWNSESFWINRMPQVLWVLAIGSVWTLIHRMYFIWKEFRRMEFGEV